MKIWILFALLAVIGKTAYYTVQKKLLDDDTSSLELSYISAVYGVLFFAPLGGYKLLTSPPDVSWHVYAIVVGIGCLELIALWMYLHALSLCDMSIASPLKRMKPTLVALFEPVLLGTVFNPLLVIAAASTGLGGYIVLMKDRNLLAPFKRLTEPGPALALVTAVLYAGLSLGSRFGASELSPFVFGLFIFGVMAVGYGSILLWKNELPTPREHVTSAYLKVGSLGVFRSAMIWIAYSMAAATMVSMVAQLTILLDVAVGGKLLKEGDTRQRLAGAGMILLGVIVALLI